MTKVISALLATLLVAALCVGCVRRYVSAPGASGRVVDAQSGMPVAGALVTVTRQDGPDAQTRSSQKGTFRVHPAHGWYELPTGGIWISCPATLTVEHEEYQAYRTNIGPYVEKFKAGEVRLERTTK